MQKIQLPYQEDSYLLFQHIKNRHWPVLLDSGVSKQGFDAEHQKIDILAADPILTLDYKQAENAKVRKGKSTVFESEDPYDCLRFMQQQIPPGADPMGFGVIGYLSYGLGSDLYQPQKVDDLDTPLIQAGLYRWIMIVNHQEKRSYLMSWDKQMELDQVLGLFKQPALEGGEVGSHQIANLMSKQSYYEAFDCVKEYLKEGDCYQVNLAQPFQVNANFAAYSTYAAIRKKNPVPYGAYLNYKDFQILSFSPEGFLNAQGKMVSTYPIKGTSPRFSDKENDLKSAKALQNSAKNRAENLMIVDLLRNDLGKVCKKGSIEVPYLFQLKSFTHVHHLESKIVGELDEKNDYPSLLKACFPGGSITGAPKKRAMEIIDELEVKGRGVYCGSVFAFSHNSLISNIAIRTAIYKKGKFRFWAGGGIVYQSNAETEFEESIDKAKVFNFSLA